jgi:hypothetical protein
MVPASVSNAAFLPLHAGTTTSIDIRLAVAAVAGLAATLGMTVAMRLQSRGYVPAYVAASALWRRPPERISWSAANAVHVVAGMLAGVLFEVLVVGAERLRPALGIGVEVIVAGVISVVELLALGLVALFLYGFFAWVVFPRYGGVAFESAAETVRRQWAVSVAVYAPLVFATLTVVHRSLPV